MHLTHEQPGTFLVHLEHQEHKYLLPNGVSVHETIFVLNGRPAAAGRRGPAWVYYAVELHNTGAGPATMQTFAYADLRGQTGHDVVAEFDKSRKALVAWNASEPDWVRTFGCSEPPDSYETCLDRGKAVADADPGALSNRTDAPTDPLGVFRHARTLAAGETARFYYVLSFGNGRKEALANLRACPPGFRGAGAQTGRTTRGLRAAPCW